MWWTGALAMLILVLLFGKGSCVRRLQAAMGRFGQLFYLVLVMGGLYIFNLSVAPHLDPLHNYLFVVIIPSPYIAFFLASVSNPGRITKQNFKVYQKMWPFDNILFAPKECYTCLLPKPARSKHCSSCGYCVARFDHHCLWINNCVGYRNHRYFLLFLVNTTIYCSYGFYTGCVTILHFIDHFNLKNARILTNGSYHPLTFIQQLRYVSENDPFLSAFTCFTGLAALILIAFTAYNFIQVMSGKTGNESEKWGDIDYSLKKGFIKLKKGNVPIKRAKELPNIYDNGPIQNLFQVIFPKRI
jgi:hypothetical protein